MDFSSPRSQAANPSSRDSKRSSQRTAFAERNNENCKPNHKELAEVSRNLEDRSKNFMSMALSSASKRKILAEKNDAALMNSFDANPGKNPQMKSNMTSDPPSDHFEIISHPAEISSVADHNTLLSGNFASVQYDPLTNYTCPRPQFLRYNPDRRREIFLRAEGELRSSNESGSDWSPCYSPRKVVEDESISSSSIGSKLSSHDEETEDIGDDGYDEVDNSEEYEEEKPRKAWKLVALFLLLIIWGLCIHSLNPDLHPSLQEYGDSGLAKDDNLAHYLNVPHGYVMGIIMGLSDVCLDMPHRDSTCGIEDNSKGLLVSYSQFRDEELPNGNELVTEGDIDLFINDLEVVDLVDKHNRKIICNKLDIYYFADQCYEEDEAADVYLADSCVIQYFTSTSSHFAEMPLANAQDGEQKLHESFQMQMVPKENDEPMLESAELTPTFSVVTTNDQGTDMHEILNSSGAKFNWGGFFTSPSKNDLQLLLLLSSLAMLSFICTDKCSLNCRMMSIPAIQNPVSPSSASGLAVDEDIKSTISAQMMTNMIAESDVHQKYLRNPADDHSSFSSIKDPVAESSSIKAPVVKGGITSLAVENSMKPPVVELLGEFSIAKGPISEIDSGQRFKRKEANPEITLIHQSQRMSERKIMSACVNEVTSCTSETPLTKFVSNVSTTVQKHLGKEDSGVRMEVRKTVDALTPLRRSSRIRNRITSP